MLPATAIWISTSGLTLADGDTTVDSWLAGWGGIRPTLTAPAATNRPAYTAGAVPVLTFDGVDNALHVQLTKGSAWSSFEVGWAGTRVAFGAISDVMLGYGIPNSILMGVFDLSTLLVRVVGATAANTSSVSDPDGIEAHWSGDNDGANGNNFRKNGTVEANAGAGALTSRADGNRFCIGGNTYGSLNYGNLTVRAAYAGPSLSADQRTYLRALLTYYTGVAS